MKPPRAELIVAAALSGFIGFFIGGWHGRGMSDDATRKMLMYADLPPICEEKLREGYDAYIEGEKAMHGGDADAPFIP